MISIVVPIYNSENFVEKLINSVINQTYSNYELILVDDGSTDSTYEILKKYQSQNVHVYTKQNEGVGKTREFGFNKAQGDIIFFCDADDYLPNNNVLETISNVFTGDVDMLIFDAIEVGKNGSNVVNCFSRGEFKEGLNDISALSQCFLFGSLSLKAFKKSLLTPDCFCDGRNFEDTYTTYLYLNNCNNFYYLKQPLYVIDMLANPSSLTKQKKLDKFIDTIDLCAEIYHKSKLKESCTISAFNYYVYMINLLNKEPWSDDEKIRLKQKMLILENIFYNKLSYIKEIEKEQKLQQYFNFKKSLISQKVIIVDGVPTVGKSTLTDILDEQLNNNFIETKWLHEEVEQNLISISNKNLDEHFDEWQKFLDKIQNDNFVYLIDSNFFKIIRNCDISTKDNLNVITEMFRNFVEKNSDNIIVVLLKRNNIKNSLLSSFEFRGEFWEKHCLKHQNLKSLTTKEEQYQNIYENIFNQLNAKKFKVLTDGNEWKYYAKEILKEFCLNCFENETTEFDISKICGDYVCDGWKIQIYTDETNKLFVSMFWDKVELKYIKDNVYKLKSFPMEVHIWDDYLIFSGNHEWNMKGKKFIKQN